MDGTAPLSAHVDQTSLIDLHDVEETNDSETTENAPIDINLSTHIDQIIDETRSIDPVEITDPAIPGHINIHDVEETNITGGLCFKYFHIYDSLFFNDFHFSIH